MNEKRFKLIKPLGTRLGLTDIFIKDTQEDYYYNTKEMVVDLLNRLSEENEQLKKEHKIAIDEMITDYKNLEKENEQLRENLHNCRLNKNIISDKLKLWQDVHKEYDIYSIKEFKELMKKVK